MEIRNVNMGDNRVGNVNNRRASQTTSAGRTPRSDSVDLSAAAEMDSAAARYEVDANFPPRMEKLSQVGERIQQNAYDADLKGEVAESLVDTGIMRDVEYEAAAVRSAAGDDRTGQVDQARSQITAGYYDNPAVIRETAENLLGVLGMGDILG